MSVTLSRRTLIGYLLLHALLFVGLYQVGYTPAEWAAIAASAQAEGRSATQQLAQQGPLSFVRAYYRTDSDERLYREYANLSLTGHADFAYIAGKQYSTEIAAPVGRAVPYRDVRIEYPPLSLLLGMVPPRLISGASYEGYRLALGAWSWLLYAANLLCTLVLMKERGASESTQRRLLQGSLLFCLLLGNIVATRIDHLVTLALVMGVLCIERCSRAESRTAARWAVALGAIAALGALTKVVPALLVPAACVVWMSSLRPDRYRLCLAASLSSAVTVTTLHALSWWSLGEGYLDTYGYHSARGIQLESSYGSALLLASWGGFPIALDLSFGSSNLLSAIDAPLKLFAPALLIGSILLVLLSALRARVTDALLLVTTLVLVFIVTNKVFSPQYLIWIALPVGAVATTRARPQLLVLLLAAACLSQVLYPRGYAALKQFWPPLVVVLVLRNVLVLALTAQAYRLLLRAADH